MEIIPLTVQTQELTFTVSSLCNQIRDLVQEVFPSVWVTGEVNRVREHRSGHCYFELIEKGAGDDIVGKLEAVAWRSNYAQIRRLLQETNQSLAEGQQIRCCGQVDFYPPFGRLQFVVREIDPIFSLGELARRRREILATLLASGKLELNKQKALDPMPLRVGLVTSHESAAYHDFLSSLGESGFGFEVCFVHAAVQGRQAESEIRSALNLMARQRVDCIALVRGGGSRSDLAIFDSLGIAEAIADSPVPVLTGLGHQIDMSIADRAAYLALKTPTQAAEFLVQRVREGDARVAELRRRMVDKALMRVREGREALGRAQRGFAVARFRLRSAERDLVRLARGLPAAAGRLLQQHSRRLEQLERRVLVAPMPIVQAERRRYRELSRRIVASSNSLIREWIARVEGWERLVLELSPARVLARGFSITRDARGRRLVDPSSVRSGDRIQSELAGGTLNSRVEPS